MRETILLLLMMTAAAAGAETDFDFRRDVGSILTKRGCNNANCHGGVKGRGGFKLSAGGIFPKEDHEWIVKGGEYQVLTAEVKGERKPRVDLAAPEKSLLLLKATGSVAHGGGRRFAVDAPEYRTLLEWVRRGAPLGNVDAAQSMVTKLEIAPRLVTLEAGGQQQLRVTAHFADGRTEDFTSLVVFHANDPAVVAVSEAGMVSAKGLGETAVLVRGAGQATSAVVGVIGAPLAKYPETPRANFIDDLIFEKLRRFRVIPSELSSDEEFLRRVCLDLAGRLPPAERVRQFIASKDPKKREKVIDALIGSPEFVDYWTFRFDDVFRVAVFSNGITPKWMQMYADWIRESIALNKPYDQMARERLAAQGYDGPTRHYLPYNVIGPPEEMMAEQVRVFFGRRLDCAQCHNHPYENWSQDQFWGMAAFFGRMFKMGELGTEYVVFDHPLNEPMGNQDVDGDLTLKHPRTKAALKPVLLDGHAVEATGRQNPRQALAQWMTRHPYFAQAAVNRIWSKFFGRGLVDPVDDFRSTNPPTHPELLERLAQEFRASGHDLRKLMRLMVTSRTYQLSSVPNESNRADLTNYSHAQPRALEAEILLDALGDVTGTPDVFTNAVADASKATGQAPRGTRAVQLRAPDLFYSRFLELYGRPNRLTLPERDGKTNLGQALHMLAGASYTERILSPGGRLAGMLARGASDEEIITEFYLAAFSRLPQADERQELMAMMTARAPRERALQDFVWAILGSREFAENH